MPDDNGPFHQLSYDELVEAAKARGYPQAAAEGWAQNWMRESGGKPWAGGDKTKSGEATSIGLSQWHLDRKDALEAFAREAGKDWRNPSVQLDFWDKEVREKYPKLHANLMAETDSASAEQSIRRIYEKPKSVLWAAGGGEPALSSPKFRFSNYAMQEPRGKNTSLVLMAPEDYLRLSPELEEEPFTSRSGKSLRKSFEAGDEIEALPNLDLKVKGPSAEVTAQDGRHRAMLAQEEGLSAIPVAVRQQGKGTPTEVLGQQGSVHPVESLWKSFVPSAEAAEKKFWEAAPLAKPEDMPSGEKKFWEAAPLAQPEAAPTTPAPAEVGTPAVISASPQAEGPDLTWAQSASPTPTPAPAPPMGTTAGGIAASATRGLAPYAAGAGIGAALGGPPGAAIGAGAVMAEELASGLFRPVERAAGLPEHSDLGDATNALLDLTGLRRPGTPTERMVETAAAGAGSALSGAGGANALASMFRSPAARAVATRLALRPGLQTLSGGFGGAAGQGTAELGGGPLAQYAASLSASLLPFGPGGALRSAQSPAKQAAKDAVLVGYTIPPSMAAAAGKPSTLASALEGGGGAAELAKEAALKNQPVTNRLAAVDLGLARDAPLSKANFDKVRTDAGRIYDELKYGPMPYVQRTPDFYQAVDRLGWERRAAAQHFSGINVAPIETLQAEFKSPSGWQHKPTSAVVERLKTLREDSRVNMDAEGDTDKITLGKAQRDAAMILEKLVEDNLAQTGNTTLLKQFRDARQLIAKSYDVEAATDRSTLDVDARKLGALYNEGNPLTGNLKIIADTANHFKTAMRPPAMVGGTRRFSGWDFLFELGAAQRLIEGDVAGAALLGVAPALRPGARSAVLSRPFQRSMVGVGGPPQGVPLSTLGTAGVPVIPPTQ